MKVKCMIRVIIVDDMPKARCMLRMLLSDIEDIEVVNDFGDAIEALDFLGEHKIDIVFMDIEMPELNGLDAADRVAELEDAPEVIFLTAYSEYSLEAWKTDAIAYLVKPFVLEDIAIAIEKYRKLHRIKEIKKDKIEVMCFPVFNVFLNGKPVYFKNKKAKEVMAYLVHSRGGWVENNDICSEIFEEMEEDKAKNNLRTYVSRLKITLEEAGIHDIIEQSYGKLRINTEKIQCDYYAYLEGDTNLFSGEYLKEYYWAEPTLAIMQMEMLDK